VIKYRFSAVRVAIGHTALIGAAIGVLACEKVSSPDIVNPQSLYSPTGALVYRAAALTDFANAYGYQILQSGLIADEFTSALGVSLVDERNLLHPSGSGAGLSYYPYDVVQTALLDARRGEFVLKSFAPAPLWRVGQMYAYAGYLEVFLAENMCSGIPIASVSAGTPGPTTTLSRFQLLARAMADFDSASANVESTDSMQIGLLAQVGKARALLDSGDFQGAKTLASAVPLSFVYTTAYDGVVLTNPIYGAIASYNEYTVSNLEGTNGLDFRGGDPRLAPIQNLGSAPDGTDTLYLVGPTMSTTSSGVPLASGVEAGLIVAEADFRAGNAAWASDLDALRQGAITPSMQPIPSDSTTGASSTLQRYVMFRERAFWLFATGHRQGDLRRLVRQYGLSVDEAFPAGSYKNGMGQYGTGTVFVPFGEGTNPNYSGCLNQQP